MSGLAEAIAGMGIAVQQAAWIAALLIGALGGVLLALAILDVIDRMRQ